MSSIETVATTCKNGMQIKNLNLNVLLSCCTDDVSNRYINNLLLINVVNVITTCNRLRQVTNLPFPLTLSIIQYISNRRLIDKTINNVYQPFHSYNTSTANDFENILSKCEKSPLMTV